jgi:hypothetical protein
MRRTMVLAGALTLAGGSNVASAQQTPPVTPVPITKTIVQTQDALPRYDYSIATSASALLISDAATFAPFAAKVRQDVDTTLDRYDVTDRATMRHLLAARLSLQMLSGHEDREALTTIARIRSLEDKPDARLLSGLVETAMIEARRQAGAPAGPAYQAAFGRLYAALLAPLPWAVVGNRLKEMKSRAQIVSRGLLVGNAKASYDAGVAKSHTLGKALSEQRGTR